MSPARTEISPLFARLLRTGRRGVQLLWARNVLAPVSTASGRLALATCGARVGPELVVRGRLRLHIDGEFEIGARVRINSGPANYVGGDRRMAMWVGTGGKLSIGDECGLSNSTIVCMTRIDIGARTFIGGGCEIYDTDFHPLDPTERASVSPAPRVGSIQIGPGAFIGAFSIVLKNSRIGEGSVVGAGSLVSGAIPDHELWAGVPAKFIRKLGNR